jgi:hypothetical protein
VPFHFLDRYYVSSTGIILRIRHANVDSIAPSKGPTGTGWGNDHVKSEHVRSAGIAGVLMLTATARHPLLPKGEKAGPALSIRRPTVTALANALGERPGISTRPER